MDETQIKSIAQDIYDCGYENLVTEFGSTQANFLASCMVAQSKVESAHYTSNVFNTLQNAFGYGFTGTTYNSYVGKPDYVYGAKDVAGWIRRRKVDFENVSTVEAYADALQKNDYFEGEPASAYARDMDVYYTLYGKPLFNLTKPQKTTALIGACVLVFLAIIFD